MKKFLKRYRENDANEPREFRTEPLEARVLYGSTALAATTLIDDSIAPSNCTEDPKQAASAFDSTASAEIEVASGRIATTTSVEVKAPPIILTSITDPAELHVTHQLDDADAPAVSVEVPTADVPMVYHSLCPVKMTKSKQVDHANVAKVTYRTAREKELWRSRGDLDCSVVTVRDGPAPPGLGLKKLFGGRCSVGFSRWNRRNSSASKNSGFEPMPLVSPGSAIPAPREWLVIRSAKADATLPTLLLSPRRSRVPCTLLEGTGYPRQIRNTPRPLSRPAQTPTAGFHNEPAAGVSSFFPIARSITGHLLTQPFPILLITP